jgi:hypothetical protein
LRGASTEGHDEQEDRSGTAHSPTDHTNVGVTHLGGEANEMMFRSGEKSRLYTDQYAAREGSISPLWYCDPFKGVLRI